MDPLMQPWIIENVFRFLEVFDIDRCQYVCKAWCEAARQKLGLCSIDHCRSLARCELWVADRANDYEGFKQLEQLIMENREKNKVEFNKDKNIKKDYTMNWYLERASIPCRMSKLRIDSAVERFLTSDAKCVPKFSFIRYSEQFEHIVRRCVFDYPVLLIKQGPVFEFVGKPPVAIDTENEDLPIDDDEAIHTKIRRTVNNSYSCLEAFHINQYTPGVRIVVTDWLDMDSPRPILNDPDYPVKFILYLSTYRLRHYSKSNQIRWILRRTQPTFAGGILHHGWRESCPTISYLDSKERGPKAMGRMTITFAGRRVMSAFLPIDLGHDYEKKLKQFKRNLDFPIDGGRLIGFFLVVDKRISEAREKLFALIPKIFPNIVIIKIAVKRLLLSWRDNYRSNMVLHLIKF